MLRSASVLAAMLAIIASEAASFQAETVCLDEDIPALRLKVSDYGKESTFRSFMSAEFDPSLLQHLDSDPEPFDKMGPVKEFVLLHCPSGQAVHVSGFRIRLTPDGEKLSRVSDKLFWLTQGAFDRTEKYRMDQLADYFSAAGYPATYDAAFGPSCACDLLKQSPFGLVD